MYSDEQIWRYVDGLMEAGDAQRLKQQAQADEELQARIEQCRLIRSEVLAGAPEPPPDFAAELARRAAAAPVLDLAEARRVLKRALVAAALLAAVGLALLAMEALPGILRAEETIAEPLFRR